MGQYHVIANLDKKEFIDPHAFGNGVKLMEFSMDGRSTMTGLAVLLASSNGMGGGDLHLPSDSAFDDVPGRWAGDRIVIAGDYDDREGSPGKGVYGRCGAASPLEELANTVSETGMFTDISHRVLGCLLEDHHFREEYINVESTNKMWSDYIKRTRREAWVKARPDDEIPAQFN
jgi:hypothetical protein